MLGLVAWIVVAVVAAEWFWWIVGMALVAAAVILIRRLGRACRAARLAVEAEQRAIAARADQQHAWALADDERGTFGDYPPADLSGTVW